MSLNGFFSTSVLGMRSQALALKVIGTNVSNVRSGGYKRGDTNFATVLSHNIGGSTDNNGTIPNYYQRISQHGQVVSSSRGLDLAISGNGFFVTNTQLDGNGQEIYSRDGNFSLSAENTFTVTDSDTGVTYEQSEAYIIDKNGNYLMGYERNADGTFPTTGTLVPIRVDQNAFSNTGQATGSAEIVQNLPSEDVTIDDHLAAISAFNARSSVPDGIETYTIDFIDSNGTRQFARLNYTKDSSNDWSLSASYQGTPVTKQDLVTVGGTLERDDQYSISINGENAVTYTVSTGDTLADVVDGLVSAVNASSALSADVTASAGTTAGTILLTGVTADEVYTVNATATNGSPTSQTSTVTLAPTTINQGEVFNVVIDGTTVSYAAASGDTLANVRSGLVSAINANATINSVVTASNGTAAGEITIVGDTAGDSFTLSSSSTVPQTDTITVDTPTFEAGDVYNVTVNGTLVSYTTTGAETSVADIRNGLVSAINGNGTISAFATASAGTAAGDITLRNFTAGGTLTTVVSAANGGLTADNTILSSTSVAAGTNPDTSAIADALTEAADTPDEINTAEVQTTRATGGGWVTTDVTDLVFNGDGQVTSPTTPVTLSFSFPASGSTAASTASFDLDVSGLTQFSAPFTPRAYERDGFEAAELESVSFNQDGHVVGQFANGTGVRLYQVPLARFTNENGLEAINGMAFIESAASGAATIETVEANGAAIFLPFAKELSNVSITDEFTKMIQTQTAYNASANSFRTQDEMLELLKDTKR